MQKISYPMISLFPEDGMKWGLWADRDDFKQEFDDGFLRPSDLNLSSSLTGRLEEWNRAWLENYGYRDRGSWIWWWKADFDINEWLQEGLWVAGKIEEETGVFVERKFAFYLHRPVPLVLVEGAR